MGCPGLSLDNFSRLNDMENVRSRTKPSMYGILVCFLYIIEHGQCRRSLLHYCPENIHVGWLSSPPYVSKDTSTLSQSLLEEHKAGGALVDILQTGFMQCCRTNFTFQYEYPYADISMLVEATVNSSLDIVLPIRTNVGKQFFLASPFVPIIESPGCVFYNLNRASTQQAVANMLLSCLPAVLLLVAWVCTFGVLFWIVDIIPKKAGEERTYKEIFTEISDSIWWAFVTLATVGYGDVVPSRIAGRILCYIWLLCSSVSVAYFSATVTSMLITECFNADLKVESSEVAVLDGSREHSLVVQKNGIPITFDSMETLLSAVKEDVSIDGVMIDLYSASYYLRELHSYRIQNVFEDISSYGVVLRTRTMKLQYCLVQYVLSAQRSIYEDIREKFPPLKTNITLSASEETSQSLLAPKVEGIRNSLIGISATLFLCTLVGVLTDKYKIRKRAISKSDSLENFVLLRDIKYNHRNALNETIQELQQHINELQNQLDRSINNLDAMNGEHLFRASYNSPS